MHSGKVEIGQGILTAVAQIVADELDVEMARIRMVPATTASSPNEGVTSGSLSIQHSGVALRYACAEARAIYLEAAAQRLGVAVQSLEVRDGDIVGPGNLRTSYWELAERAEGLLERDATAKVAPKPAAARRHAGTAAERIDIPDKVLGRPRFIHDLALPGLLHARVLRPPSPGATLATLDETKAKAVPGVVAVVRDGSFAGIVAETEDAALAGLKALAASATWQAGEPLPDEFDLRGWIRSQPVETTPINTREAAAPARVARTVRREYGRPFIAHASMAPSCAIAQWADGSVRIWTHTQGIYNLRADLELVFGLPPERIVVEHAEGAGCYGQNGADDVALEAALLARAVPGRPVRLQWSREDEMAWAPMGAAQIIDLEADLDEQGEIVAWRHDVWGNGHVSRPGRGNSPRLQAAWQLAKPFPRLVAVNPPLAGGGGSERNATPGYDFPAWRIANHRLLTMPIRTSSLRTLGAFANVFAIESFMDELAAERGEDPLAFRLRHLKDPRARAVSGGCRGPRRLGRTPAARGRGPRPRLCPLQGLRRLLRRGGRGRGRGRHPRAPAGAGGGRGRGDQPRRRDQSDGGRRHPGHQLGAEGGGALRPHPHHQRHLGDLSDPALLRGAGRGGGGHPPPRGEAPGRRRGRARPGGRRHRQRGVRRPRRARARPADYARADRCGDGAVGSKAVRQ